MRRCLILYGLTCLIAQVLALRELAVAFQGNELIYGAALAAWLVLFAGGSGLLGRLAERFQLGVPAFALTLAGSGVLVPLTLLLARSARWGIIGKSGMTPGFGQVLAATLLVLAPLCLVLGFFYALACAIALRAAEPTVSAATRVYAFEALGTFIGGILFTFLLTHVLGGFQIALLVAATDCLAAFLVWRHADHPGRVWGWVLPALAAAFLLGVLSPVGRILDFASQATRYPGRVLKATLDSPYGRVDVAEGSGQTEFYQTGVLVGATQMERVAEEMTFLALLAHPAPRRALILGGSATAIPRKALQLPWLRLDCVELDGKLIRMALAYGAPENRAALLSARVRVFTDTDGRLFVKRASSRYDVILSAMPNPTTGLINRFYTAEFFREARDALTEHGVLALRLEGSPAYMGAPHRALAASVFRTLRTVFGSVAVLPLDHGIFFVASPEQGLYPAGLSLWPQRLTQWGIEPAWLTPAKVREITRPDRIEQVVSILRSERHQPVNTDLHPVAYYHALLLWADAFRARGRVLLERAAGIDLYIMCIAVTLVTGVLALAAAFARKPLWVGLLSVRLYSGMAGFVLELVLIFAFQSFYGYAYGQLGLLFASFMAGIALGAVAAAKAPVARSELQVLMLLQTSLAVLAAAMVPALTWMARAGPMGAQLGAMVFVPLLNFCVGAIVGAEYPLSVAACSAGPKRLVRPAGLAAGLYAMDLAGACLGALVGGGILIPVLGLPRTCLAMAILSVAGLPLLLLAGRRN